MVRGAARCRDPARRRLPGHARRRDHRGRILTHILRIRDLSVTYPGSEVAALDGVDVDVPERGSVALVGESGSGKSTLALAVSRLLDRDTTMRAGEISFLGTDVLGLSEKELSRYRRRELAMVFQDPRASWNPTRTIAAQLLDGLKGDVRDERRARLVAFMRRVGIDDPERRLDAYPHQFSGGMLQRSMLAGGLSNHPRLLIADEPTSALDTTVQAELLGLIDELRAEYGLSLLLITHDLGVVGRLASGIVVLYAGLVVEQGATEDVLVSPLHPYTRELMAATPRIRGARKVPLRVGNGKGPAARGCRYALRCGFATSRCESERPLLRAIGTGQVACHHAPLVPEREA